MAKSTGEFLTLDLLSERGFSPRDYRYFCLTAHYRSQMAFSWKSLESARTALRRLYEAAWSWGEPGKASKEYLRRFHGHLNEDLNMPRALAAVWELARSSEDNAVKKATIIECDEILGLDIGAWRPEETEIPAHVRLLIDERLTARNDKDWARADALREEILELGYALEDTKKGTDVSPI